MLDRSSDDVSILKIDWSMISGIIRLILFYLFRLSDYLYNNQIAPITYIFIFNFWSEGVDIVQSESDSGSDGTFDHSDIIG